MVVVDGRILSEAASGRGEGSDLLTSGPNGGTAGNLEEY